MPKKKSVNIFDDNAKKVTKVEKILYQDDSNISRNDIKEMVKQELSSLVIKELSEPQKLIMKDYVKGMSESDLIRKHQISLQYYNELISNPLFVTKAREELYSSTYASKDINLRLNNSLIDKYMDYLTDEKLADMSGDRLGQLIMKHMEFAQKATQDNKIEIKVDVTTLINKNVRENRLKQIDGKVKVESKYPVLNQSGEIIDSWDYKKVEE